MYKRTRNDANTLRRQVVFASKLDYVFSLSSVFAFKPTVTVYVNLRIYNGFILFYNNSIVSNSLALLF